MTASTHPTRLTKAQRSALSRMAARPACRPGGNGLSSGEVARVIWPDAPGWKVHVRTGPNGVSSGRQMKTAGGAYMARLVKLGLVRPCHGTRSVGAHIGQSTWVLTDAAMRALEAEP
jgi:hypothetical protein